MLLRVQGGRWGLQLQHLGAQWLAQTRCKMTGHDCKATCTCIIFAIFGRFCPYKKGRRLFGRLIATWGPVVGRKVGQGGCDSSRAKMAGPFKGFKSPMNSGLYQP